MTDAHGLAVQAVALKALATRVADRLDEVKEQMRGVLGPGDRTTARLNSGLKVGSVVYTAGRVTARVTDASALSRWVADRYPTEVEPQVRPAFLAALLDASKRAGAPMTPHGELDVPGIQVAVGEPYLTVTPDRDALESSLPDWLEALRANAELALPKPPALDAAPGTATPPADPAPPPDDQPGSAR